MRHETVNIPALNIAMAHTHTHTHRHEEKKYSKLFK